jgi:dolichol-phosphate mannosyltransferase
MDRSFAMMLKYCIVGFSGVIVNMGVLYALTEWFGIYYLVSSVFAVELSIINNFIWNDRWTFVDTFGTHANPIRTRIIMYHVISAVGALANIVLIYILTSWFGVYYIHSNAIAIIGVFVINYLLNSRVTWKRIPPTPTTSPL